MLLSHQNICRMYQCIDTPAGLLIESIIFSVWFCKIFIILYGRLLYFRKTAV
ncbi:unnamed protein product [Brugia timori]|uniref:Uncharacterized protein n=1 Tax=Brugia timori TaxID=42155 RepID=A0A0R3QD24_9BILA|nr:unnamed protein product [Brugia timori]